jgi:hypothetical protein
VPPFPPIPIPGGLDEIIAYALIVYDEHSIVSNIDWGVFHSMDAIHRSDLYGNVRQSAILVADDFLFESFEVGGIYPRTEVLFARETDSQKSLGSIAPSGECILHIAPGEYEYKLILDNELLASYRTESSILLPLPLSGPVSDHGWVLGFITVLIPAGEHNLSIATRVFNPTEFEKKFSCGSGEKLYAYTDIEKYRWTDEFWVWEQPYRYRGGIVVSNTLPEVFEGRRLILYHGDRWLAPDHLYH